MAETYDIINPAPQVSLATKVITWLQGRTTGWLISFFITGNVFHITHRLDATYITFMTTFMTFVIGHSIKEDYFKTDGDKR